MGNDLAQLYTSPLYTQQTNGVMLLVVVPSSEFRGLISLSGCLCVLMSSFQVIDFFSAFPSTYHSLLKHYLWFVFKILFFSSCGISVHTVGSVQFTMFVSQGNSIVNWSKSFLF